MFLEVQVRMPMRVPMRVCMCMCMPWCILLTSPLEMQVRTLTPTPNPAPYPTHQVLDWRAAWFRILWREALYLYL